MISIVHVDQYSNDYTGSKQRRQRCKCCSGCPAKDCGRCTACRDKIKFGGPGKLKQCCIERKCIKIVSTLSATIPTKGIEKYGYECYHCYDRLYNRGAYL